MRTLAAEKKLCTQMGNQGTAEDGFREGVELIRSGILGPIKDIYVWTNRPVWPQGLSRPTPLLCGRRMSRSSAAGSWTARPSGSVQIKPGLQPFDFRLLPGKELRLRVVDGSALQFRTSPSASTNGTAANRCTATGTPNALDTQIPTNKTDSLTGVYVWSWLPTTSSRIVSGRMATRSARGSADTHRGRAQSHVTLGLEDHGKVIDSVTG